MMRFCVWTLLVISGLIHLVILLAFGAEVALGFPENFRHGYSSCGACHVSPAGGGAVNGYGRSAAGGFQSTFKAKSEEEPFFGLAAAPDWLAVGGDTRYVNVNQRADSGLRRHIKFWMQEDVEVAVSPLPPVTFAYSVGRYGPDQVRESRRSYVKMNFGDHFTVRAGRFMPAFGIAVPDHTLATRAPLGLGQGQETYNLEGSVVAPFGELFVTGIYGNDTEVHLSQGQGYDHATDTHSGLAGRAAVFLGDRAQIGVSYLGVSTFDDWRQIWGGFAMVALNDRIYALAEADRKFENADSADFALAKLGWEILEGFHIFAQGEVADSRRVGGGGVQWFPRPHWEVVAELKRTIDGDAYVDSGVLMLHHYL